MAPAAQTDRAETYFCVKPIWVPANNLTVALRWAVIMVGLTFVQRPVGVLKRERGGVRRGAMLSYMGHPSLQCLLWAQEGVSCCPLSYFLTSHAIFMCYEYKYYKYGGGKFTISGGDSVEHRAYHTECYI